MINKKQKQKQATGKRPPGFFAIEEKIEIAKNLRS